MAFPQKLQILLNATGKTRAELAAVFGCNRQRIDDLFSGRVSKIRPGEAELAAEQWRVNPQWLLADEGEMFLQPEQHAHLLRLKSIRDGTEITRDVPGLTAQEQQQIQQLFLALKSRNAEMVRAALGAGADQEMIRVPRHALPAAGVQAQLSDDTIVDHLAFRRHWLTGVMGLDPSQLALIDMNGDAMAPTVAQGDLLLLDTRSAQSWRDGLYAIAVNGMLVVRRLCQRLSGQIEIGADNPFYGVETLDAQQVARLDIVGRVVWHGHPL